MPSRRRRSWCADPDRAENSAMGARCIGEELIAGKKREGKEIF
jgi:hypothetical protein